jgi:hypothetical protein
MPRRKLRVLVIWLVSCLAIIPSQIFGEAPAPTVTFTFDFPGSDPEHYVIKVAQDGHASYTSNKKSEDGDSDSFNYDFMLQAPTTSRIFDLTKRAKYFEGEVDLKKKNLASTGVKILAYQDAERSHQTTYNFSMVQPVQELTQIFQNLATSMEFGRRLEYYHKYQKLALPDELKRMEQMARDNGLGDLQPLAPILTQIANDPSLMNQVRASAQRLLAAGNAGTK